MHYRISHFNEEQKRLKKHYKIVGATPIHGYDEFIAARIEDAARIVPNVRFATTSGTTGFPKRIMYSPQRLRDYRADALLCAVRTFHQFDVRNPTFFVLSSHKKDDSFSSFVLHNSDCPAYSVGLFEPARYLTQPAMISCIDRFGASAVRLWLIVVSNPGVLYATNPSTIAAFFADIQANWMDSTSMIRAYCQDQDAFSEITPVIQRVATWRYMDRMQIIAKAVQPVDIKVYWPGLTAWCSWDGGYVGPYVRQVKSYLKSDEYTHIPIFSMSTEVVQTLTHYSADGRLSFLPIAKKVVYEFLPERKPVDPCELISWRDLKVGHTYSMVVSDCYGLLRYHTEDVFECRKSVQGIPDLRFLRRRGISFSFTGEKVTAVQLSKVFDRLIKEIPWLNEINAQLCCFPSRQSNVVPHYQLVIVLSPGSQKIGLEYPSLGHFFDKYMSTLNGEFANKQLSSRLGQTRVSVLDYNQLAAVIDRRTQTSLDLSRRTWESQFKLSPLYLTPWEQIRGAIPAAMASTDAKAGR